MEPSFDLRARARQAMQEAGFAPQMPPTVFQEVQALEHKSLPSPTEGTIQDLRALYWSSVDNETSRDLDQVEYAELRPDGSVRLLIGIADVDYYVPKGSAIDQFAGQQTTTVYSGVEIFPMLPPELSNDITSLLPDEDRLAVVTELVINGDSQVLSTSVYRALLRNHAKLDYDEAGAWLDHTGPLPDAIVKTPALDPQLRLQNRVAMALRDLRRRNGALDFETIEANPVVENGKIVSLSVPHKSAARYLIENFMVAANTAISSFLSSHGLPSLQRIVRRPERWSRIVDISNTFGDPLPAEPNSLALSDFLARRKAADPEHFPDLSLSIVKLLGPGEYTVVLPGAPPQGHFGLAVQGYTHSTAPNRRYADLITQRLLKAAMQNAPSPYTETELMEIANRCNSRSQNANKVEREMRKVGAAVLLGQHIGDTFHAIVTGVTKKGTFVRLTKLPAEGRIVRGESGVDVGDKIDVRLLSTDPYQGFIDFERISPARSIEGE